MRNLILAAVAASSLALAGCVSTGTNFKDSAVRELRVGQSLAEVKELLGKPSATSVDAAGTTVVWMHTTGSMMGAQSRMVRLRFDKAGKLTEVPQLP